MINFGKYAILDNPTHYFKEEPELWWRFRCATSKDELAMARFYESSSRIILDANGESRKVSPHWIEIMHREIAILFDETNITDEDGKPVLRKGASIADVEKVLGEMPQAMVEELWIALGEAVAGWGPVKPPKEPEAGQMNSET